MVPDMSLLGDVPAQSTTEGRDTHCVESLVGSDLAWIVGWLAIRTSASEAQNIENTAQMRIAVFFPLLIPLMTALLKLLSCMDLAGYSFPKTYGRHKYGALEVWAHCDWSICCGWRTLVSHWRAIEHDVIRFEELAPGE